MDLNDLLPTVFGDLSSDEQIEKLRQIRLARKGAVKKQSTYTKITIKQKEASQDISPEAALELLKLLQ